MKYYEIYAWARCPFCANAKELLIAKNQQFMLCCIDQSDILLSFLKKKYSWDTVPMIIEKNTESSEEKFIGGFTDLKKYLGEDSDGKS
tara:strand:+ start:482 stop:745 length:264 start_codon:yes stop_codon:yes gene_type:complete